MARNVPQGITCPRQELGATAAIADPTEGTRTTGAGAEGVVVELTVGLGRDVIRGSSGEGWGIDVGSGNHGATPAYREGIDGSNGEVTSPSYFARPAAAPSYVQAARASQYCMQEWPTVDFSGPSNQGARRSFRFNPEAAEFIPSLPLSTLSTPTVSLGGSINITREQYNITSVGTSTPTTIDSYPSSRISTGVTLMSLQYTVISSPTVQPTNSVPWSKIETTDVDVNQSPRDWAPAGNQGEQQHHGQTSIIADSSEPGVFGNTILSNYSMEDPTSEPDEEDDDPVTRANNRKRKGKDVVRDQVADADNVSLRPADPRLCPGYQEKKPSNRSMWKKERRGKDFTVRPPLSFPPYCHHYMNNHAHNSASLSITHSTSTTSATPLPPTLRVTLLHPKPKLTQCTGFTRITEGR